MLSFIKEQEYNELIVSLRDYAIKMNENDYWEDDYNELLDQMNRILNEHITLKYALDKSIITEVTKEWTNLICKR